MEAAKSHGHGCVAQLFTHVVCQLKKTPKNELIRILAWGDACIRIKSLQALKSLLEWRRSFNCRGPPALTCLNHMWETVLRNRFCGDCSCRPFTNVSTLKFFMPNTSQCSCCPLLSRRDAGNSQVVQGTAWLVGLGYQNLVPSTLQQWQRSEFDFQVVTSLMSGDT